MPSLPGEDNACELGSQGRDGQTLLPALSCLVAQWQWHTIARQLVPIGSTFRDSPAPGMSAAWADPYVKHTWLRGLFGHRQVRPRLIQTNQLLPQRGVKCPSIALPGHLPCSTAFTLSPPTGSRFRVNNMSLQRSLRTQEGSKRGFPDFALARQKLKASQTDGIHPAPLRKSFCHITHPFNPGLLDPGSRKVICDA